MDLMKKYYQFYTMRLFHTLFFIFFVNLCFSQHHKIDSLSYGEKLNSGIYPPFFKFTPEDSVKLPFEFQVELIVEQIRDVDIKKNNFYTVLNSSYSTIIDTLVVTKNDSIYFNDPLDFFRLLYPESDRAHFGPVIYSGRFKYPKIKDSVHQWTQYSELELPHKWNLRDYPFDKQKLKVIFESAQDTSYFKLNPSVQFPPKIDGNKFNFLMDGINVTKLTVEKNYVDGPYVLDFIEGQRNEVLEQLIYNIEIDRVGSYLYFKLFFGGFLSFLISFLVYFIDYKNFDTRITLSLGGIFGAVGNKYFVENSMPSIQVLTKADIINNLVIIFIIINIFIVITQYKKTVKLWKFEKNKFSAYFIFLFFILLNTLVIIF